MDSTRKNALIIGFGNPLLDMTVVLKDTSLHNKYNLPTDGQLEVSTEQQSLFSLVMERMDVQFTAGGCALNTLRVFSWVLGEENKAVFVGGIGEDERAEKLASILEGSGVITRFVLVKSKPTGSCAALVLGAQRCLCADIGAASICKPEHVFVEDSLELLPELNSGFLVYLEGYFITHSFDTALRIARHCRKKGKLLVFNLCGSYVCENHYDELNHLLPYVDILFGYIEEYKTLQKFVSLKRLCEENSSNKDNIVHDLQNLFKCLSGEETPIKRAKTNTDLKRNGEIEHNSRNNSLSEESHSDREYKSRNNSLGDESSSDREHNSRNNSLSEDTSGNKFSINNLISDNILKQSWQSIKEHKFAVITQGPSPLLYALNGKVYERSVAPIHPSKIIDTTGAGDSFVGGFLASAAKGEALETCLDCGVWSAQQLLQEKGCTVPTRPATFL